MGHEIWMKGEELTYVPIQHRHGMEVVEIEAELFRGILTELGYERVPD